MAQRNRSQGRLDGGDEPDPAKLEFISNLQKMMYFYNRLQRVTPQFNPIESHLLKPHEMVQSSIASNMLSMGSQRVDSMPRLNTEDAAAFKPTKPFKYEVNPFDTDLLAQKRDQVIAELQFLEDNQNRLAKIDQEVNNAVRINDSDMDVTQNSNVKWFETATMNVRKVESMTNVIDQQENIHLEGAIAKKDSIIELQEDQNNEYMATIAELDKQIAETRRHE